MKRLFHGTSNDVAKKICEEGFRPELNRAAAYGRGVYFATAAAYSKDYSCTKRRGRRDEIVYLIVADVALGKSVVGMDNAILPNDADSFCDRVENPSIYVVNKREACCPRYLIAFYPDAR